MAGVLESVEAALVEHFGHRPQRASVSFVGVDPIEVLRFEPIPGERAYLSLGMSRHPMTGGAETFLAQDGPRAELMLHLRDPGDDHAEVWRRLAVLAAAPAVESVVYAPDMTVDLGEPLVAGSACTGVLVTGSSVPDIAAAPAHAGSDPLSVTVLQVVPATSTELAWGRVRGAAALRALFDEQHADLLDLTRAAVSLAG